MGFRIDSVKLNDATTQLKMLQYLSSGEQETLTFDEVNEIDELLTKINTLIGHKFENHALMARTRFAMAQDRQSEIKPLV